MVILASSVVFLPRLRGTEHRALSPAGDQARSGYIEVFEPISSTNTNRSVSIWSATNTRQAVLWNSSRSAAPTDLFLWL
jgi:hypothetical protein